MAWDKSRTGVAGGRYAWWILYLYPASLRDHRPLILRVERAWSWSSTGEETIGAVGLEVWAMRTSRSRSKDWRPVVRTRARLMRKGRVSKRLRHMDEEVYHCRECVLAPLDRSDDPGYGHIRYNGGLSVGRSAEVVFLSTRDSVSYWRIPSLPTCFKCALE